MHDNIEKSRFELRVGDETVFADYRCQEDLLFITYVYAPPILRGTGAAGRLMDAVARRARDDGQRIVALCGYAGAWLRRHPAHRDLLT